MDAKLLTKDLLHTLDVKSAFHLLANISAARSSVEIVKPYSRLQLLLPKYTY